MKKIVLYIMMILSIVSCGVICDSKPPKRAIMHNTGGMGMQYHFTIYIPGSGVQHSPRCPTWTYGTIEIYSDKLGNVLGDEVLWNNIYGEVNFSDYGEDPHNIKLYLSSDKVVIQGWGDVQNGTYKVETSSPDSWGVPIDGK
jgi:hypothetical protein